MPVSSRSALRSALQRTSFIASKFSNPVSTLLQTPYGVKWQADIENSLTRSSRAQRECLKSFRGFLYKNDVHADHNAESDFRNPRRNRGRCAVPKQRLPRIIFSAVLKQDDEKRGRRRQRLGDMIRSRLNPPPRTKRRGTIRGAGNFEKPGQGKLNEATNNDCQSTNQKRRSNASRNPALTLSLCLGAATAPALDHRWRPSPNRKRTPIAVDA